MLTEQEIDRFVEEAVKKGWTVKKGRVYEDLHSRPVRAKQGVVRRVMRKER